MERIGVRGIITLHETPPEWSEEDLRYWWCPQKDAAGRVVAPARMSDEAKMQRCVARAENLLTNNGLALYISNNAVAAQINQQPFAQILSVGNGTIAGVSRGDTSVSGDGFATGARKAPAYDSVVGFQSTVVFSYGISDAMGQWTNIGLYGYNTGSSQNATTTTGTGSLMTHALFNFTKGSTAYTVNYVFLLSN